MSSTDQYFGWNMPFFGGAQNVLSKQVGLRLIKNDLKQLYLTRPGERIYRPTFGTHLRSLVFESFDSPQLDQLRSEILDVTAKFEPRVVLSDVVVTGDRERRLVTVQVFGQMTNDPAIAFNLEIQAGAF